MILLLKFHKYKNLQSKKNIYFGFKHKIKKSYFSSNKNIHTVCIFRRTERDISFDVYHIDFIDSFVLNNFLDIALEKFNISVYETLTSLANNTKIGNDRLER